MISVLISLIFAATALLTSLVLVDNWRTYGRDALALRGQLGEALRDELAEPMAVSELRYRIIAIGEPAPPPKSAVILRPQFRALDFPELPKGQRAAA